ncbi:hypothetical protein B9Z55_007366 [Caenorhabditis nigoni]|uniref:Uncharacterized protein n=2 Tax=Caenorhabditis nigoni TaxID=1611254 RepID=A0A2G5V9B8_9PELO|nr:hypothetical protein B9Z55_007366 [Caenorhabditis nigoni]
MPALSNISMILYSHTICATSTLIFIALIIDIMTRPIARISKKKTVTVSILKTLVRKLERQNAHQRNIINSQADHIIQTELMRRAVIDNHRLFEDSKEKVVELEAERIEWQEEMENMNQENLKLNEEKPTSYLYEAKNGAVPQVVKEAFAAHFYYLGRISKRENYIRWSQLEKADRKMWTEEWEKIKEVQKVQAAQGLIVLKSQIKEEVEDERKWAMVLRSRH